MIRDLFRWDWTAFFITCATLAWVGYLYFPTSSPIVWLGGDSVHPTHVQPGDRFAVTRNFMVTRSDPVVVTREMISGNCDVRCKTFELQPTTIAAKPGIYTRTRAHTVPPEVPPGVYRLEFDVLWEDALGRKRSQDMPILAITVVPKGQ